MSQDDVEKVKKRLLEVSDMSNMFANPVRARILDIILNKDGATWSQIQEGLEQVFGRLNPNTISFHLSKLTLGGAIIKRGNLYTIPSDMKSNTLFAAAAKRLSQAEVEAD
jgi:DNA-binding transcriptional ArsR family regulator